MPFVKESHEGDQFKQIPSETLRQIALTINRDLIKKQEEEDKRNQKEKKGFGIF